MGMISYVLKLVAGKIPATWLPSRRLTVVDSRSEPPTIAYGMTADRIHSIVAAAESGDTRDLFALYRDVIVADSHLQTEIGKRKLAVLGDKLTVHPFDKNDPADVDTATEVESAVASIKGWTKICAALLDGCLYPLAVVEKVFEQEPGMGFQIKELIPVPYQLLDFTSGKLMIRDSDERGAPLATMHEPDPRRYIVHRGHLLSAPDNWGGPMRSILFWWLLSAMDREWWARFLERFGTPFVVGKYDDTDGRSTLQQAFSLATRLGGLVISRSTEVEIMQAAASDSGEAYEKFLAICQREKSKLILGQTLSSEAQPTGLGSGTADMQEGVRQDIRQLDAALLAETVRDQLVIQFCQVNNLPGKPPSLVWGSESDRSVQTLTSLLKSLSDAGLQVSDDSLTGLSEKIGMTVERKTGGGSLSPFSISSSGGPRQRKQPHQATDAVDAIASAGAADLSQAFRRSLAPIAQIVRESRSATECEERIKAFCVGWRPDQVNTLVSDALGSFAANGSIPHST